MGTGPRISRRSWLQGTGALAAAWVPGVPAVGQRRRLLFVGDSLVAGGFGLYLETALRATGRLEVRRSGKSSSGLARPDFFDWPAHARELTAVFPPHVSLVMFGGNDVQGLWLGGGAWIRWQDAEWSEEYARRVGALCDILAPAGQSIVWLGMPIVRSPRMQGRVQRINDLVRRRLEGRAGARFVDTWRFLAAQDGAYSDHVIVPEGDGERRVLARAGDGVHLTRAGAHLLKDRVLGELLPFLGLGGVPP